MPGWNRRELYMTLLVSLLVLLSPFLVGLVIGPTGEQISVHHHLKGLSSADAEAVRTAEAHLVHGFELCDPLPCWVVMQIRGVTHLEQAQPLEDDETIPIVRSKRVPAVATVAGAVERPDAVCPAGSRVVGARFRDRWWSPSGSPLDGRDIAICVTPEA